MKINTIAELIAFIKHQISLQTTKGRKTCRIEIESIMFYKLIKLIQFCLRDDKNEPYRKIEPTENTKSISVKINGIQTYIIKK